LSKDDGDTWSRWYNEEYSSRSVAFDPQNPDVFYANLGYDLAKSTDGGESWPLYSTSPLQFFSLSVHPQNPQILYGGDARLGVYQSVDGGLNWQPVNQGIKANSVYDSAISAYGDFLVGSVAGAYLRSGGGNWEQIASSTAYSVAFDPEDENTIYAGFAWDLRKSTNSGQTWSYVDITSEYTDPHHVSSIVIDPQNPSTLYLGVYYSAGDFGELYTSIDGGESIARIAYVSTPVNAVQVSPTNSQIIYIGSGMFFAPKKAGGVNRTTNGGVDWELTLSDVVVNSLATDPENPSTLYAACGASDGTYSGVFKSINRGRTWVEKDFGLPDNAAVVDMEVDQSDNNIIYAATYRHGIYISHDGGDYWTLLGLSDYDLLDILTSGSGVSASKTGRVSRNESSSSELYAGSGSGMMEFTGSGLGIITGTVTDAVTGMGITGATLSTDTGGIALSLTGHYVMNLPAGLCTVSASMEGYQPSSASGIVVTSGEETTVDFALDLGPVTEPDCPAEVALRNNESQLSILRSFRDKVLNKKLPSLKLSELYYEHSWELVSIFLADEKLRKKTALLLIELIPGIQSVTEGGSITITTSQLDTIKALLARTASHTGKNSFSRQP